MKPSLKYLTPLTVVWLGTGLASARILATRVAQGGGALTDEAVVPCHVCPLLSRFDLVVQVHAGICPELAARREGRQLDADALASVFVLAAIGAPALRIILLVPGIDDLDREAAFCAIVLDTVLVFLPRSLARGRHRMGSCGAWPETEPESQKGGLKQQEAMPRWSRWSSAMGFGCV